MYFTVILKFRLQYEPQHKGLIPYCAYSPPDPSHTCLGFVTGLYDALHHHTFDCWLGKCAGFDLAGVCNLSEG